ncbi:hypothetical protein FA95DRAFT_1609991 [Auriscalpium vulgare]|uniref:Uncharacterized protein n=1 Tax=Auriscalpium vulgare TaxID=40419 RepID=A0ACB8RFA2_9AGAM|nr:hypothetical protein FA95DRAFT_1609991 [Auriscalpium vulgare]
MEFGTKDPRAKLNACRVRVTCPSLHTARPPPSRQVFIVALDVNVDIVAMSVATPTVIPRPPLFPTLLPRPPQPHPIPLPRPGRAPDRINTRRDLVQEMDDLSDEEAELEEITLDVKNRGYSFLVPIGKVLTQHEEKNDADEGSGDDDSARSSRPETPVSRSSEGEGEDEDEDEEDGADLDDEMEDMDEEPSNVTDDAEEGETDELDDAS